MDFSKWLEGAISLVDRQKFRDMLLSGLEQIHEGNIAQDPMRPAESVIWKSFW